MGPNGWSADNDAHAHTRRQWARPVDHALGSLSPSRLSRRGCSADVLGDDLITNVRWVFCAAAMQTFDLGGLNLISRSDFFAQIWQARGKLVFSCHT